MPSLPEMRSLAFKAQAPTAGRSFGRCNPTITPPFWKLTVLTFTCGSSPVQSATIGQH